MLRLPRRLRKLIGAVVLLIFLAIYCLVAMAFGATRLPGASVLAQTAFYVIAGFLWLPPAMALIWWMQRPDPTPDDIRPPGR